MNFSMGLSSCGEDDDDSLIEKKGGIGSSSSNESREMDGDDDDDMDDMHHYHHRHHHALEFNVDYFWPVEHPMEPQDEDRPVKCPMPTSSVINPQDEDRPVKCPMPTSSVINDGGRMCEERLVGERMGLMRSRRDDQTPAIVISDGIEVMARQMSPVDVVQVPVAVPAPVPFRAVRKRQHTLTQQGDHLMISPFTRTRMPPPLSHNLTSFQMLNQFDKFV